MQLFGKVDSCHAYPLPSIPHQLSPHLQYSLCSARKFKAALTVPFLSQELACGVPKSTGLADELKLLQHHWGRVGEVVQGSRMRHSLRALARLSNTNRAGEFCESVQGDEGAYPASLYKPSIAGICPENQQQAQSRSQECVWYRCHGAHCRVVTFMASPTSQWVATKVFPCTSKLAPCQAGLMQ